MRQDTRPRKKEQEDLVERGDKEGKECSKMRAKSGEALAPANSRSRRGKKRKKRSSRKTIIKITWRELCEVGVVLLVELEEKKGNQEIMEPVSRKMEKTTVARVGSRSGKTKRNEKRTKKKKKTYDQGI